MNRIIIDTDAGVDDAQAILAAFGHQGTQVEAITTVSGNVDVEKTTANVLKVLDLVDKEIPVYKGSALPLVAEPQHASFVHGEDGLGDCGIPASQRVEQDTPAAQAIIDMVNKEPGNLSIVALGPLTNIAIATMLDPDLPSKVKEVTIMGGAVTGKGNTHVNAEFNIYFDPEAARIVFDRWPMVRVVDWEVTVATGLNEENIALLDTMDSPKAEFNKKIHVKTRKFLKEVFHVDMMFAADALAMAAALEPALIKHKEVKHLTVELTGSTTRGQTVVDWMGMGGGKPNAEIVMEMDQPGFVQFIANGLR